MKLISRNMPQLNRKLLLFYTIFTVLNEQYTKLYKQTHLAPANLFIGLAEAHVVLEKNDYGQNLVLNGENGRGGGGDQLVIAGSFGGGGGGGQSNNMIMQDAANREGDVVINGRNIIIPGEDGHIVLADSRSNEQQSQSPYQQMPSSLALWLPYMYGLDSWRIPPYFRGIYL